MKPKNRIIIFEGIDKTGKSALIDKLHNYCKKQMIIHRWFISNMVYEDFYSRDKEDWPYMEKIMKILKRDIIIVYTECDHFTYAKRCVKTEHPVLTEKKFNVQKMLFDNHLKESKLPVIRINTTSVDIKKSFKELINVLNLYD